MILFLSTLRFPAKSSANGRRKLVSLQFSARLQKARLDYEAFTEGLYAAQPKLQSQRGETRPVSLAEAGALLPGAKSALLEYVITDEATYLFVLTKEEGATQGTLQAYTLAMTRKELGDRVEQFRGQLARRDLGFRRRARELHDQLLGPAREQLPRAHVASYRARCGAVGTGLSSAALWRRSLPPGRFPDFIRSVAHGVA